MKIDLKELRTKSNILSLVRFFLFAPFFLMVLEIPDDDNFRYYTLGLIFFAYITDVLDGFLARRFNEITEMGKIIDPLADKICVIAVVIGLYKIEAIPEYYLAVIILRDLVIFLGGIYVSKKIGKVLPSNLLGKMTIVSIGFFIMGTLLNAQSITWLYSMLLYISLFFSFASVVGYGIRGYESIKWKQNETV
ncbi:MAG: CDP-alcohol phosphatidyltransferase family protein [Melioribacteraceae bacterium]|nr:CDP-alcohol phosphatidyltransferase family protein [Melioribacteraceae bacterium]